MTNYQVSLVFGCGFALLGVVLGAIGAHQLADFLKEAGRTETYELAVRYQFYHEFALLIIGILQRQFELSLKWATFCFTGGILLFSGSLYILCFTGIRTLGAITPFGGVLFIAGWIILLLRMVKR